MSDIQMFDPDATPQRQALVDEALSVVATLLKRQAARADDLRAKAALQGDDRAWKQAEYLERDVLAVVSLVQAFNALCQQQEADNQSAWALVEMQDRRAEALKRFAREAAAEATANAHQFNQLNDAFAAYVLRTQPTIHPHPTR